MTTQHTPGPWAVNPFRAQVDAFRGQDALPLAVCQLLWPTKERSEAETEANGRLIAAAPDLLGALHNLMNGIDTGAITSDHDETFSNAVGQARAALSKASAP